MNDLYGAITEHALKRPESIALQSGALRFSYSQLLEQVSQFRDGLAEVNSQRPIALAVDNHPAWVVIDVAALTDHIPLVPLPSFFADAQILHAVMDAGVDRLITDTPDRHRQILSDYIFKEKTLIVADKRLTQFELELPETALPTTTSKITYTSGTTGNPKGVCLNTAAMLNVAFSIAKATEIDENSQHLCVLPLSTLLENVAGVYASLISGGTIHLLPSKEVGLYGSQLDIHKLHQSLLQTHANTAIFIPELLNALVTAMEQGLPPLPHLKFLAVGGASVPKAILVRAQKLGLPVYQGYGLSECASVVALNTSQENHIGSVGKPLAHVEVKLAEDDEILVKCEYYLGYTGKTLPEDQIWYATGDIGTIDDKGYLYIKGRKRNIFITSFGRNVSPEWVECELLNSPYIAQACVFGEAKPWNVALIVAKPNLSASLLAKDIDVINQRLPDYAQVRKWILVNPFTPSNGQLTLNGRLKRKEIYQAYEQTIENFYKEVA